MRVKGAVKRVGGTDASYENMFPIQTPSHDLNLPSVSCMTSSSLNATWLLISIATPPTLTVKRRMCIWPTNHVLIVSVKDQ